MATYTPKNPSTEVYHSIKMTYYPPTPERSSKGLTGSLLKYTPYVNGRQQGDETEYYEPSAEKASIGLPGPIRIRKIYDNGQLKRMIH